MVFAFCKSPRLAKAQGPGTPSRSMCLSSAKPILELAERQSSPYKDTWQNNRGNQTRQRISEDIRTLLVEANIGKWRHDGEK